MINLASKKAEIDKKDKIEEKVVCCECGKIFSSQEKLFLHRRNFHPDKTPTMIPDASALKDKPTQPLKDIAEVDKDRLKLKSLELSEAHLDKDLEKLAKEKEAKDKGKIDINELLELKKLELLTQKPQADSFSSVLPLMVQQNQQSFLAMQDNSNRMFQLMMTQQDKQTQLMLEVFKLQTHLQNGNSIENIGKLSSVIANIKSVANELGLGKSESDGFVQQMIKDTLDKISPPLLEPIGRAIGERIKNSPHPHFNPTTTNNPSIENQTDETAEITENESFAPTQQSMVEEPQSNLSTTHTLQKPVKLEYEDLLRGNPDLFPTEKQPEKMPSVEEELTKRFKV